MPNFYSSDRIIRALEKRGFIFISQRGSHKKFRKVNAKKLTVIVPAGRKEVPWGTFYSILRQSHLKIGDFKN